MSTDSHLLSLLSLPSLNSGLALWSPLTTVALLLPSDISTVTTPASISTSTTLSPQPALSARWWYNVRSAAREAAAVHEAALRDGTIAAIESASLMNGLITAALSAASEGVAMAERDREGRPTGGAVYALTAVRTGGGGGGGGASLLGPTSLTLAMGSTTTSSSSPDGVSAYTLHTLNYSVIVSGIGSGVIYTPTRLPLPGVATAEGPTIVTSSTTLAPPPTRRGGGKRARATSDIDIIETVSRKDDETTTSTSFFSHPIIGDWLLGVGGIPPTGVQDARRLIASAPSGVILTFYRPPPAGLSGLALLAPSSSTATSPSAATDFARFNALGILGVTAAVSQLQLTAATAERREREARRAAIGLTAIAHGAKRFVMPGRLLRSTDAIALGWRGPLGTLAASIPSTSERGREFESAPASSITAAPPSGAAWAALAMLLDPEASSSRSAVSNKSSSLLFNSEKLAKSVNFAADAIEIRDATLRRAAMAASCALAFVLQEAGGGALNVK